MGVLIAILVILWVLLLTAVLGSGRRGYGPAGLIGAVTLILLILLLYTYA
jgi:hypothetical protein